MLNSSIVVYYLRNIASTKQNGYFEYKPVYVSQLPIYDANESEKQKIEKLVGMILENKHNNSSNNTTELEQEIDRLVYELYGLTGEEIGIVEGTT